MCVQLVVNRLLLLFPCLGSVDVFKMVEIPFSEELQLSDKYHEKKNRPISVVQINAEWSLVCVWSHNQPFRPEIVEIRRSTVAKEILVSGNFELMWNGEIEIRRKFVQLIEADFSTTQLELEYSKDSPIFRNPPSSLIRHYQPSPAPLTNSRATQFHIAGNLKIPADLDHQELVEGVQFKSLLDLSKGIECLLDSQATYFSDVTIKCVGDSFRAHKNILCARSPVFAAMFTTQMKENQNNKVDITDLSSQVFKTMLAYIYSGRTGKLSVQSAGELLFASDKYQLQDLMRICRDYLTSCMSVDNVLHSLVLGYLHDEDLKEFAMEFICDSCEEFEVLEKTAEWKNVREKIPSVAMDVLTRLVINRDKKLKRKK